MSLELAAAAPPRPPAGPQRDPPRRPARRPRRGRAGRAVRDAALRLRPRRHRAPGGGARRPSSRAASSSPTRSRRTRRSPSSRTSAGLGSGADVASGGELATARRAGIAAGPDRHDRARASATTSSRAAVAAGIRAVTVESPGELAPPRGDRRRTRAGSSRSSCARPSRSTPGWSASASSATTAPASSGWTPADLPTSADRAAASPHLELLGLHAFGASNVLDAGRTRRRTSRRRSVRRGDWRSRPAPTLRLVDAGGGLGIPYEPHEESLDLVGLGAGLAELTRELGCRSAPERRSAPARARSLPGRAGRVRTSRASSTARPSTGRSSSSSMAASTTCCDRRSSARSTGSARSAVGQKPARSRDGRRGWSR